MRLDPGDSSEVEDRRDEGGGGGFAIGARHIGIGGIIILGILSLIFKRDLISPFLGTGGSPTSTSNPVQDQAEAPEKQLVVDSITDVQRTWQQTLPNYRMTRVVLFRDQTSSGCGTAETATGPFYCPADEKVYIDLGFYEELKQRFGVPGEFAQAYVLAHEVGHHVQKILGIEEKVRNAQQARPSQANQLSVGLELQADCFAGVWGHSAQQRNKIDAADVQSGLAAAAAVGDDRLQRMAGRRVSPENFTHGSSAQRVHWFEAGMQSGSIDSCNTFGN
jgi:predicted metalloprotease